MPGLREEGFNGGELLKCKKCGRALLPDSLFCTGCGAQVHSMLASTPAAPVTAPDAQPAAPAQAPQAAWQTPVYAQPPQAYAPVTYEPIPVLPRTDLKPWAVKLVSGGIAFAVVALAILAVLQCTAHWPF